MGQPLYSTLLGPSAEYYNGKTYVVFQGFMNNAYCLVYNHSTETWSDLYLVGRAPLSELGDSHGGPAIVIDNSGYIHVVYGAHISLLKYYKSTNPGDASAWTEQTDISGSHTYPYFVKDSTGAIYLFYRGYTADPSAPLCYKKESESFVTEYTIIEFGTDYSIYKSNAFIEDDKVYHAWCHYYTGTDRYQTYVAYLDLDDSKMYSVDGTDLGSVISKAEADTNCLIWDEPTYVSNSHCICVVNGKVHVITNHDSATGYARWHHYWNGSAWSDTELTSSNTSKMTQHIFNPITENNIEAYLVEGTRQGDLKLYRWNGSSLTYEADVLDNANAENRLGQVKLVENYDSKLKLLVAGMHPDDPDATYSHIEKIYGFTDDLDPVYNGRNYGPFIEHNDDTYATRYWNPSLPVISCLIRDVGAEPDDYYDLTDEIQYNADGRNEIVDDDTIVSATNCRLIMYMGCDCQTLQDISEDALRIEINSSISYNIHSVRFFGATPGASGGSEHTIDTPANWSSNVTGQNVYAHTISSADIGSGITAQSGLQMRGVQVVVDLPNGYNGDEIKSYIRIGSNNYIYGTTAPSSPSGNGRKFLQLYNHITQGGLYNE